MFAPTAVCPLRKRLLVGEVDDENAYAMGGVAGHAGLFAPVKEVDRIAAELLASYAGQSDFVPQKIVQQFWAREGGVRGSTWALGWDSPSTEYSSSGHRFSPAAVGHLGQSWHLHLDRDPHAASRSSMLTNRVHPAATARRSATSAPKSTTCIMEALGVPA